MKAIYNNIVIAESDKTIVIEGNHYFPPDSIKKEFFKESSTHTTCPWKGLASYYTIEVDGDKNNDTDWYYPSPSPLDESIKNHVAFWRGVKIEE